jgi:hypothetical protein
MKPNDFDTLLNRYLNGELGPAEERTFLHSIEGNAKLQQLASAESIMRSALRHDRASIPTDHGATRAAMIGKLGALSAGAAGAGSAAESAAHGSSAAHGLSTAAPAATSAAASGTAVAGGSILAGLGAKLMIVGVTAAIAVGSYIGLRTSREDTPAQVAPPPVAAPVVTAPAAPTGEQMIAPQATTGDTAHTAPVRRPRTTGATPTGDQSRQSGAAAATASGTAQSATTEPPSKPSTEPTETDKKPEVITKPKADMKVGIDRPPKP